MELTKSPVRRASKHDREQCMTIILKISDFIPGTYASEVQELLKKKGYDYTEQQIRTCRQMKAFHLPVALAMQELYDPDNQKTKKKK